MSILCRIRRAGFLAHRKKKKNDDIETIAEANHGLEISFIVGLEAIIHF